MKNPAHQSRPVHRSRSLTSGHLALWLVLLLAGTAIVLFSIMTDSPNKSRQSAGEANRVAKASANAGVSRQMATVAERKQGAKSTAGELKRDGSVKPDADADPDFSSTNREKIEAELFLDSPVPMERTARVPTSSATLASVNGGRDTRQDGTQEGNLQQNEPTAQSRSQRDKASSKPREERLTKGGTFNGDLRNLPRRKPVKRERPEREDPESSPTFHPGTSTAPVMPESAAPIAPGAPITPSAPAPAAGANFDGLDFANWGAGHPPDTNGDVGPTYYIQTINSSVGIFTKSDGVRVAAFTLDTFMSQGNFGNLCDTNNFGDPVVLYDSFEDRWIITDFAFSLDAGNNVINPPGAYQCIAASKTGDPVSGGWNFYSINTTGGLGDYPKLGVWPDGIYMSVNMFGYPKGAAFQGPRVYAFNKAQMYAGRPTVQSVSFNAPAADFTILPSNARLQTGTPPTGSPNYFISTWEFLNAVTVYKFHVDWNAISSSTFTGPDTPSAATSWPNASVANAPSLGGNSLDVLQVRAMMQNQYINIGGAESLWTTHTVRRANTTGFAAPRWYQLDVTGGTVAANILQAATWDPDAANVIHRFMPSLALDRIGDMALGYSTSSSTTKPAIKYAGRLATDPVNTFSQTEQLLIQGTGTQVGNCGGAACLRWGDYSAMSLDPDGCTFWFTGEYYAADGLNHQTRIGSFSFPQCTPVGSGGSVSGTVTDDANGNPISGATVALGSRTTTTDTSGVYTFSALPAGTYPIITASFGGYNSASVTGILVSDSATTTQNLALTTAISTACPVDTSLDDFLNGLVTNVDLTTSPGDIKLAKLSAEGPDQVSSPAALSTTNNLSATTWTGQTFRAGITGNLTKISVGLGLASGSSGTITVEIRNLSGSNPGTTVLATGTVGPVTNVGTAALYTTTFAAPAAVVSGTSYSVVIRTSVGNTVFGVRGSTAGGSTLANGQVFTTTTSGASWTPVAADLYFTTYVTPPLTYQASGNFVSGVKDANSAAGIVPYWKTLSWTETIPTNTNIQFQAAASNSINGPFDFVGPDGTAATFFTSGASLTQFNGFRYLKYKALLSTTDNTITPTLSDVTICFTDTAPTITAAAPRSRQQGSAPINEQIAIVTDPNQSAETLNVTATPLTGTGVIISNINVDSTGHVTATAGASCLATNSTFTLAVNDTESATVFATLTVNVIANTAPTLTFNNDAVNFMGASTINPATGPADNGSVASIVVQSAGTYTGNLSVNNTTGVISISNAAPVGAHIITIRAKDYCDANTDASFTLNVNKADQTITVNTHAPSNATYNTDFTVDASSSLPVTYSSTGACTNVGATFTMTSGTGTCTVKYNQAGDANYNAATQVIESVTAQKVTATVALSNLIQAYDGSAKAATATTDPAGKTVNITYTQGVAPVASPTNAGSYNVSATISDANYQGSKTGTLVINKATPTITWSNPADITYGAALGATQLNATASVAGPLTYTPASGTILNAGSNQTLLVNFTPTDTSNYNTASKNVSLNVLKANQTITFNTLSPKTFGEADFPVSATASSSLSVTFTATDQCTVTPNGSAVHITGAGNCTITASQPGDGNYYAAPQVGRPFTIDKATPPITWNNPADIVYGTTLGGTQLNATASVAGNRVYTPLAGTVLHVGANQTLHVDFTPTDTANYNTASKNVSINVTKATLTVKADDKSRIFGVANPTLTYAMTGFAGSDTQASATSGAPSLSTTAVLNSNVGDYPITAALGGLSSADYLFSFVNGTLSVMQASGSITLSNLSQSYDGTPRSPTVVTNPIGLSVTFTYTQNALPVISPTNVGSYNITATITDPNYQGSSTTGTLTINKATPLISWNNPANITYGTPLGDAQLNAAANLAGTLSYNPAAGAVLSVGTHQLSVTFMPTDTSNYITATLAVSITVEQVTTAALNFDNATYSVNEGDGHVNITVIRTGGASSMASVNYTTSDSAALANCDLFNGIASSRCDYTTSVGTLRFGSGETSRSISIPLVDDAYAEGPESFSIALSDPLGESLGAVQTATITITDNETVAGANPLLSNTFFVRQQYMDFLGREPEPQGISDWLALLNNCATGDTQCDRIEVSSGFFRSKEFQERGYFIYRFYAASLGRKPNYSEFMPDLAKVSGFLSDTEKEANKAAFVNEFMARQEFKNRYDSQMSGTDYVDALLNTAGLPNHPSRATWIEGLQNSTLTRTEVLRQLAESAEVYARFYNEAFVVEEYFGYLRRDPDAMYLQWIDKLNQGGDYRELIDNFLSSPEYRMRFGP